MLGIKHVFYLKNPNLTERCWALNMCFISKTLIWQKNMLGIKHVFYLCDICLKHFFS
jgi:hypothetical protein